MKIPENIFVTDTEIFIGFCVALGCGLLIGLQREQAADEERRDQLEHGETQTGSKRLGGVRTYPLFALAGALSALLARPLGAGVFVAILLAALMPVALGYADALRRGLDRGTTSPVAFVVVFMLGALCLAEGVLDPPAKRWQLAVALATAVTALLSLKEPLHRLASRLTRGEFYDTLIFLVLLVIVLPQLPNQSYGPLNALNPFHIGLMIILMSGISFVGYVTIRLLGSGRGMSLTGLIGGLVSSTAVTLSAAGRARREPGVTGACALAIMLACAVMCIRIMLEVAVVNPALLSVLLPSLGAMLLATLASAFWLYRASLHEGAGAHQIEFSNPFELGQAVKFGALFAGVLLMAKAAEHYGGTNGLYAAAALSGLHDMDAITLSMARMSTQGLSQKEAVTAIILAACSNTLVKLGLAAALGGAVLGRRLLFPFLIAIGVAVIGLLLW